MAEGPRVLVFGDEGGELVALLDGRATVVDAEHARRLIAHDLRSPLAIVLGQCELLEAGIRGDLTERQKSSVETIRRQAERLEDLIEELRRTLLIE